MRRHTSNTLINAALLDLDPSQKPGLTEEQRHRAAATFALILEAPRDEPVSVEPGRPAPHRRRRLLVSAGLIGAAGIAAPAILLGGGTAYASWTATPEALTDTAADAAATTCRRILGAPDQEGRVALAERRGGWTYVLLAGPRSQAVCMMASDSVGKDTSDRDGFFGTHSPDVLTTAPDRLAQDRIVEHASGEGRTDEGWFNWLEGYVGSGVTGVTVHTSSGLDIEASVVGNRFAAWWPGTAQSSEHPESETWSYTTHLADGSTRRTVCHQSSQPC